VGWEVMKIFLIWLNSSSKRKKTAINISIAWSVQEMGQTNFVKTSRKKLTRCSSLANLNNFRVKFSS